MEPGGSAKHSLKITGIAYHLNGTAEQQPHNITINLNVFSMYPSNICR